MFPHFSVGMAQKQILLNYWSLWCVHQKTLCINTFFLFSKWSFPYISSHPLNGCNKAHTTDLEQLLQLKLHKSLLCAPILCCSQWGVHQSWCHKIKFWQFSEASTNCSVCKVKKNSCFQGNFSVAFWLNNVKLWIMIIWISTSNFYFNLKSK